MENESASLPPQLVAGTFTGREAFRARLRLAFAEAARAGWRELIVLDPDFADWPLGEPAVLACLTAWAQAGRRKLTVLASGYGQVERLHPLFVAWRRNWSHRIECRAVPSAAGLGLPSLLWSPAWALQRHELRLSSGACLNDPERRQLLRQLADGWLERSRPAFPADTLGL